ncbi:hypothetical protein LTR10_015456 [Elasticomyces elasticus]|uniref:Uncharacterized protein n=1 Tax=Exophiala sideris TaxID=1016849 RepID=A0ABR0J3X4_9EURO|nr:hypothetical protein LTR10_015456 [Elasticomyces elasticus]KAK5026953.1 hypothetical protein LTS07_007252 [Exophiala sideris]KAK5033957.1 hypothetical protein LTR13_006557 [Exophiala sideris]KAK5055769.1 hypothetical protein LTR69_008144 [Exophiala sideris]KAK5180899.1 hypothetical protein LTR44_006719 [Eurotiomycetes sp. CCFEE 6388]
MTSRLKDPFFLNHGSRPQYFSKGSVDDLDAAQDEVLWLKLVIQALAVIPDRVRHFQQHLTDVIQHIGEKGAGEAEDGRQLLTATHADLSVMFEACRQWLIDFECTNPIPRLRDMVEVGENIVRAHIAQCNKHIDQDRLVRLIRSEREKAALKALFEIQIRTLLCEAPDECKDVDFCKRLLDWQRPF